MAHTNLLCTFTSPDNLDAILAKILRTYDLAFDSIYILENTSDTNALCLTYNVFNDSSLKGTIPESTISLHRKKQFNVLYSINALNLLIQQLNNGMLDRNYRVNWEDYRNTILVSTKNTLRQIPTKLQQIVKISELLGGN